MPLTRRQRLDYYDTDPTELRLIRIGHAIWAILRRERRLKQLSISEETSLGEAIEVIVRLKREYWAELAIRRAAKTKKTAAYFAEKKRAREDSDARVQTR